MIDALYDFIAILTIVWFLLFAIGMPVLIIGFITSKIVRWIFK